MTHRYRSLLSIGLVAASLTLLSAAIALADGKINTNNSPNAIGGYDAVAYFTDGKAVRGKPEFSHAYQGAKWLFASAAHRDQFAKAPAKYAPRYDGYCAYGVSNGYLVPIDPQAFTIRDGVLYLNHSLKIREDWLRDVDARIRKADATFPTLAH
jgi:YHS domain-containing protein